MPLPNAGKPVVLDGVAFSYGATAMSFDLVVAAGERLAVMGPSGSGKSTMLNLIAGFEIASAGRVLIGDDDVTDRAPAQRPVSMVFQENNLFAHLDVAANVGLGRSPSLKLSRQDKEDVAQALSRVGLAGKERRLPRALSGGERQRVALARVLVRDRPVLLLDEPFASLGPGLRAGMMELLLALHAERGMTVLMVTHDPADALRLGGRLAFIEAGKVAEQGAAADLLERSASRRLSEYLGQQGRFVR